MITSQTIIERSFYQALLEYTLNLGYTLDPSLYEKTIESSNQYAKDRDKIIKEKGRFITIYGVGNNQSKGMKETFPRIVVEAQGFLPGNIGLNKQHLEKRDGTYIVSETPFEAIDQYIDIRLVTKNIADQRVLNLIMSSAISQRGYLKPYIYEKAPFDGNIFIVARNFYDASNDERGSIEKVYTWEVQDTLLAPPVEVGSETPIKEINVDIENGDSFTDSIHIV